MDLLCVMLVSIVFLNNDSPKKKVLLPRMSLHVSVYVAKDSRSVQTEFFSPLDVEKRCSRSKCIVCVEGDFMYNVYNIAFIAN